MARVVAEQVFNEPLTDERYAEFAKRVDPCLEVRNGMWRRSTLSIDKLRMVCEFEAPDAEAVREAFRTSGTAFERVWTADVYAIEDYPELMKRLRALLAGGTSPPVAAPPSDSNDEAAAAWNGVLFDKFVRFRDVLMGGFTRHSDAALERHRPIPGAHVLDLGCGFGDVTLTLARSVGPGGLASGVDIAERFVESARTEGQRVGLANARFFRADVQKDDLGGPYDGVFSRLGIMFFANPVAAMRNVKRSLKTDGLLCAVVWRKREDNPFVHVAENVVRDLVSPRAETDEPSCGPGPFSMASADVTSDMLVRAGFRQISLERHDAPVCLGRNIEEAAQFAMALGPAGEVMRLAGDEAEERRPAVMGALKEALAPYLTAQGVVMSSSAWIVTARCPPP